MGYKLEIEKLEHPLLKPLLEELLPIFEELKVSFFVIGATARDIMMEVHQKQSGRRTQDLDIAIAINNWEKFEEIKNKLLQLEHFEVDLVPYGAIAEEKNKIFWPPDQSIAMSVLGYDTIEKDLVEVSFEDDLKIKVASLILNWQKKTRHRIEYVVLHELLHLKERHHNERFKALLDQFMPN